jgi:hypothetical protein
MRVSKKLHLKHVCGIQVVCVRGNPVWMHVLKIGKVVDEIAEHVFEKRLLLGILKQGSTVHRCRVRHTLLVLKEAARLSNQTLHIV